MPNTITNSVESPKPMQADCPGAPWELKLICPIHRLPLQSGSDGALNCANGHAFQYVDDVLCMLAEKDEFYEGAYLNHVKFRPRSEAIWHCWPLWVMCNGYPWMVRKHIPASSVVVELGCAGGVDYFAQRYKMIGLDLSQRSLAKANGAYVARIQADAAQCIPLADGSVDAVISSYFWEHMQPIVKDKILAECRRVLRPNGKLVFLYDIETCNPLIGHFRKQRQDLYRKLFLEGDGHIGYQTPRANLEVIRNAGFKIVAQAPMEKTALQSPSVYSKLAQFGLRFSPLFKHLDSWATGRLFYPYTALVRIADLLAARTLPDNWARITITVAQKSN